MQKNNLEDRLVAFAVNIIDLSESLPKSYAGIHLGKQICRSGTSPALNYAEAQSAESRADFIHKIKVVLKELRETSVCIKIIILKDYSKSEKTMYLLKENDELISIFMTSVKTAKANLREQKQNKRALSKMS